MIDKFQTSIMQMGFGVSSSWIGSILTNANYDTIWTMVGRLAIVVGILASTISIINGVVVMRRNFLTTKFFTGMKRAAHKVAIRYKRKSPKVYEQLLEMMLTVAVACAAVLTTSHLLDITLTDWVKQGCSYAIVIAVFVAMIAKGTVDNPKSIDRYLNKLYKAKTAS